MQLRLKCDKCENLAQIRDILCEVHGTPKREYILNCYICDVMVTRRMDLGKVYCAVCGKKRKYACGREWYQKNKKSILKKAKKKRQEARNMLK